MGQDYPSVVPIYPSKLEGRKRTRRNVPVLIVPQPNTPLADGEHPVSFSGPFSGCCWAETGRKKTLYVGDSVGDSLIHERGQGPTAHPEPLHPARNSRSTSQSLITQPVSSCSNSNPNQTTVSLAAPPYHHGCRRASARQHGPAAGHSPSRHSCRDANPASRRHLHPAKPRDARPRGA